MRGILGYSVVAPLALVMAACATGGESTSEGDEIERDAGLGGSDGGHRSDGGDGGGPADGGDTDADASTVGAMTRTKIPAWETRVMAMRVTGETIRATPMLAMRSPILARRPNASSAVAAWRAACRIPRTPARSACRRRAGRHGRRIRQALHVTASPIGKESRTLSP